MPSVQPLLYLPADTAAQIDAGQLRLIGGVVRQTGSGQIHSFLQPATTSEAVEMLTRKALTSKALLPVGIGLVAAGAVGAVLHRRRQASREVGQGLPAALAAYLQAAATGALSVDILTAAIDDLDALETTYPSAGTEQLGLAGIAESIADFTNRLALANTTAVDDHLPATTRTPQTLAELRHHLDIQRQIYQGRIRQGA